MAARREHAERGLQAINDARAERRRAIVLGRARVKGMAPQFWLWAAVILGAVFVVYWRYAQGELESGRNRVMAKQRAVAKTLGARLLPFRDQAEEWVQELARGKYPGDLVAPGQSLDGVSKQAGVYLRLRRTQAKDKNTIRKAATRSLRDGFTACLFVSKGGDAKSGPKCTVSSDCPPGLLCNEYQTCRSPAHPYNMRLLYRALRVLSSDWTDELHEANSDLGISAYERDLDSASRTDVPVAIEVLQRARYLTLVIDEEPKGGLPPPREGSDEGEDERIQRVPHYARIGIWELETKEPVFRLRAAAAGTLRQMGAEVVSDPDNLAAQQRQANSCALGLAVKQAFSQAAQAP